MGNEPLSGGIYGEASISSGLSGGLASFFPSFARLAPRAWRGWCASSHGRGQEKKGDKGLLKAWQVRWFQQEGANLFYYDDNHFASTSEAHGSIDLTSVVAVEAVASANKKDKAKTISISTKMGRTFLLREPNDDARKAQEWVTRIDDWRKWIKDGGSASPPLAHKEKDDLARGSSAAEIKPLARGISGAVERSKLMMKKSVQGVGTLVSTTVAKSKSDEQDADLDGVKKCGWLVKKGQKRWFALKDGALLWFKEAQSSANAVTKENSAGCLILKDGCLVRRVQERSSLVVVTPTGKPYELVAYDNATRDVWLTYLTDACGGVRARAPTIKSPQKLKGWLKRKAGAGKMKPWKKIYVVQQDTELSFFESDDPKEKETIGTINLFDINNVDVTYEDGVSPTFEVRTSQTVFYFMALSEEDLEYWTSGLAQFWEQKKARGGSKSKAPGPLNVLQAAAKPGVSPVRVQEGEVRVSGTLIVKGGMGAVNDEDGQRQKVLDALENTSSDEEDPAAGARNAGANASQEPDADFDSLMDALGSEKSKSSIRISENANRVKQVAKADEEDEDSMNEMLNDSKERVQNARKPTVIKTDTASTEFSASGRITRKDDDASGPVMDARSRSKTEIQRRIDLKQKEKQEEKERASMKPSDAKISSMAPARTTADSEHLDQLSAILNEAEEDEMFKAVKPAAPKGLPKPAPKRASDKFGNEAEGFSSPEPVPAKKTVAAKPAVPVKPAVAAKPEKPVVVDEFGEDDFDAPEEKKDVKIAAAKADAKKPAPKPVDDFDDFDALSGIPSFGFSDEEVVPKKIEPKPAAKAAEPKPAIAASSPPPPRPALPVKKEVAPAPVAEAAKVAAVVKAKPPTPMKARTRRVRRAKAAGPWVAGDRVMALFLEDDLWYKGRVVKVVKGTCHVEFLGYGNVQPCEDEMIQPIPDDDLSDGDEVEVPLSDADADDAFNQELDSILSLPPKPEDSDEDSNSDVDLPVPPPPVDDDDDSDELPLPQPVKKAGAAAGPQAKMTMKPTEFSDDDDDNVGQVSKPAAGGPVSPADRKKLIAASQQGPDFDKCGLFEAASKGDLKTVKAILSEGRVYVDYQKRKEPKGWSALSFAVQAGQDAVVEFLLQMHADPNLPDGREKTALHKALGENAKVSVLKRLIDAKGDVRATSDAGDSVLHEARNVACVELVLKSLNPAGRKKLLSEHGQDGFTAMHRAVALPGNRDICEMLIDTHPEGLEDVDMNGETPLFAAVRAEALDTIALLLESGANVAALNNDELTVLHIALAERRDLALELVMAGALVTDELVNGLLEKQQDQHGEEDGAVNSEEDEDDEDGSAREVRVDMVTKYLAVLKRAFMRKTNNLTLQIVAMFRLGEEYVRVSRYYHHAMMCFNAALALCVKNADGAGQGLKLLTEVVLRQAGVAIKIRARYARNNRDYTKLVLAEDDDQQAFHDRHSDFSSKINVAQSSAEAQKVFPAFVMDNASAIFEDDWEQ